MFAIKKVTLLSDNFTLQGFDNRVLQTESTLTDKAVVNEFR
jgi:hypothetical protein